MCVSIVCLVCVCVDVVVWRVCVWNLCLGVWVCVDFVFACGWVYGFCVWCLCVGCVFHVLCTNADCVSARLFNWKSSQRCSFRVRLKTVTRVCVCKVCVCKGCVCARGPCVRCKNADCEGARPLYAHPHTLNTKVPTHAKLKIHTHTKHKIHTCTTKATPNTQSTQTRTHPPDTSIHTHDTDMCMKFHGHQSICATWVLTHDLLKRSMCSPVASTFARTISKFLAKTMVQAKENKHE